mgnify:CR=1 FL=1
MRISFPSGRVRMYVKRAKLVLEPSPLEAFSPGSPDRWTASNGVEVSGFPGGWIRHFHNAGCRNEQDASVFVGIWMAASHRHIGPARRALKEYAKKFVVDKVSERFRLRNLVREGD